MLKLQLILLHKLQSLSMEEVSTGIKMKNNKIKIKRKIRIKLKKGIDLVLFINNNLPLINLSSTSKILTWPLIEDN